MKVLRVQQPDNFTCMSACLASILHLGVNEVINEFSKDYIKGKSPAYLLGDVMRVRRTYADEALEQGCVYILMVAVPNSPHGGTHAIVADFSEDVLCIMDPAEGRGAWYYSKEEYGGLIRSPCAIPFQGGHFCPLLSISAAEYNKYLRNKSGFSGTSFADLVKHMRAVEAQEQHAAKLADGGSIRLEHTYLMGERG